MRQAYLDHSATSPPSPAVMARVSEAMKCRYGNPSSQYRMGWEASRLIEEARETVAEILGVGPGTIVFTSGGSEANNLALRGTLLAYSSKQREIITQATEHSSVLDTALSLDGARTTVLETDSEGIIDLGRLERNLSEDTLLVSFMHVNNETGSVQPIEEAARVIRKIRSGGQGPPLLHVDAVQSFGKYSIRPGPWGVDLLTISGHKLGGPKGVGALYVGRGVRIRSLITGGQQERGLRAGTENVPGIAGLGQAAREVWEASSRLAEKWDLLGRALLEALEGRVDPFFINGPPLGSDRRVPHIISLSFPGTTGEVLVRALDGLGIQVATGSACHSASPEPSHVLVALGLDKARLAGSIRVSFGPGSSEDDVRQLADGLISQVTELRALGGGGGT